MEWRPRANIHGKGARQGRKHTGRDCSGPTKYKAGGGAGEVGCSNSSRLREGADWPWGTPHDEGNKAEGSKLTSDQRHKVN